ncbi:clavaminate synthase [Kitasatospora sp. MMS16-BH015]|uniref:TauD/TfdA family dioxygenase n=1 Tax=Kitasatospora sp. MMS16-BH015 TaxID=2018025 RepID=UPI000CA22500|nr:TauD/TfdA family dioxygenase [Kitasatospora sp. MMS16-BH015]AUG81402.1 clavaminate synthase [Kitasatospora sp. MMS16-BH015]
MHSITGTTFSLPEEARPAVAAAFAAAPTPGADTDHLLDHGAKLLRNCLPPQLLADLADWRHQPTPWLTVTGLPATGRHLPTPLDGFCDEATLGTANLVHFGLLRLLALSPVAYRWENEGRPIRNVAPRAEAADTQTSWGYAQPLDWHTDDSVLDHTAGAPAAEAIPHHLSFYGMRNTESVPTDLLLVEEVLAALPDSTVQALRRPEYAVTAPESYASDGEEPAREAVPMVWTLPSGHPGLRYGPGRVTGLTEGAEAALAAFETRIAGLDGSSVLIGAGDFHVFDNRRVLHRRVPFTPAAPGAGRWLRRCYALGATS